VHIGQVELILVVSDGTGVGREPACGGKGRGVGVSKRDHANVRDSRERRKVSGARDTAASENGNPNGHGEPEPWLIPT
jgi:hypothetical protein